ncbi:phosphoglycolate phosphatase [Oceanospirillum sediminis]|uniref:phosphoglycolate phosphatase n=1 Tax=Oceanospirillum sediminis TaxID=2760088 RepID=UPI002105D7AC|nr:phosphoglycolate phosphatase [Oceanospirillum sediminis]
MNALPRHLHPLIAQAELLAFDLDGTLIDSVPDLATAVDSMLSDMGRSPAGYDAVRQWVGNGSAALVKRALCQDIRGDQQLSDDDDEFLNAHQLFLQHYQHCKGEKTVCYEGIFTLLDQARTSKIPMVLITNKPYRFVPDILQELQLASYFALVLGGDSLAEKKPSALPLLHACQQLDIPSEKGVMIGDSITDITAGKNAGFTTIAVTYGYDHGKPVQECGADLVVDSLAELVR